MPRLPSAPCQVGTAKARGRAWGRGSYGVHSVGAPGDTGGGARRPGPSQVDSGLGTLWEICQAPIPASTTPYLARVCWARETRFRLCVSVVREDRLREEISHFFQFSPHVTHPHTDLTRDAASCAAPPQPMPPSQRPASAHAPRPRARPPRGRARAARPPGARRFIVYLPCTRLSGVWADPSQNKWVCRSTVSTVAH